MKYEYIAPTGPSQYVLLIFTVTMLAYCESLIVKPPEKKELLFFSEISLQNSR